MKLKMLFGHRAAGLLTCWRSSRSRWKTTGQIIGAFFALGWLLGTGAETWAQHQDRGQVLNKDRLLESETFWDNRDFDWYKANIPFFECPDADITTTYYYRWDLLTKHLTYGSPNSGYSFTEFIDRPFWSGAFGAISCPAGHQLYESRWLRNPRIAKDYSQYWLRTPGAQPRNYSTWLADSVWAVHQVNGNSEWVIDLLPDLVANYEGWEQRHFVPEVGLFWQTGHDDGMEFNITSRQTQDLLRGAPSYRPSFNSYMWADAVAIAKIAHLAGKEEIAARFENKAVALKAKIVELLWDERRQFFFPVFKNDEERDGFKIRKLTKTYEDGQFAGDPHGRELIGYVPWQFPLLKGERKFEVAWKKLMDRDGFYANYGPSTVERNDPMFLLQKSCCWWSGQSWPYATSQTLKALANLLQDGSGTLSKADYLECLQIFARSHRKEGKPYLAEALHPDTGSFEGHDGYNHSEHYFHSSYCDQVITGLVGLITRDDDALEVHPLAPEEWDYFAMDDIPYRGHLVSVVWDKKGDRYGKGAGLHLLVDGKVVGGSKKLERIVVHRVLSDVEFQDRSEEVPTNFAVNNDGTYFPRITASYTANGTSLSKLNDGNYWYMQHPPNRWTCEGSPNAEDWMEVDFGVVRVVDTVKLFVLDDSEIAGSPIRVPLGVKLDAWIEGRWQRVSVEFAGDSSTSKKLDGHRPLALKFEPMGTAKLRVSVQHQKGYVSGFTEWEVWGDVKLPLEPVPPPAGNLAFNSGKAEYPKASASYSDRFGGKPQGAIDGITNFLPTPMNRWTSYESPSDQDWLEVDFGKSIEFRRVELAIYDDRGGVQAPKEYALEVWDRDRWKALDGVQKVPAVPLGSQWNSASFDPVQSSKMRIVFTNQGKARSGVTEVMVWND